MKLNYTDDPMGRNGKSFVVYGPSGSGKTYFAAQAPKPLYIDIEGGKLTIRKMGLHVPVVTPETYNDLITIQTALSTGKWDEDDYIFKLDGQEVRIQTIIIDTIDELARKVMKDVLAGARKEIPEFAQWNLTSIRTRSLLETFRNFAFRGLHVFFLAHEEIEKSDNTGIVKGQPEIFGKLAEGIQGMVDLVIHLSVKNGEWYMDGRIQGIWQAKDRTGSLTKTEKADFKTIWPKIIAI